MKYYYVAFGNDTQMFVIATFKGDENGARGLCDAINGMIKQNPPLACTYCNVLSFVPEDHTEICPECGEKTSKGHWISEGIPNAPDGFWTCAKFYGKDGVRIK